MGKNTIQNWTTRKHPWLREMQDSEAEMNVGEKSAQMGYTECVLNLTFYNLDVNGVDCLYVLPNKSPDAADFTASRFNPALECSEHLTNLFSDVDNIGHKRAGRNNLFIRGSKSRPGLKSIPCGFVVLDEVDEMQEENIPLALERSAGQESKQAWLISTPTIDGFGIDSHYQNTTQERFHFRCPSCKRLIKLEYPRNLKITADDVNDPRIHDSYIFCHRCNATLHHLDKPEFLASGRFVPQFTGRLARGFHVNRLYSCVRKPSDVSIGAINAQNNPSSEQEFYNSILGLPRIVEGAKITDPMIANCTKQFKNDDPIRRGGVITMGVDVGKFLHYEICYWYLPEKFMTQDINIECEPKVIRHGKALHFEQLDRLMYENNVQSCVIDANPERRKALEFALRHDGKVKMCFYTRGVQGKNIQVGKNELGEVTNEPTIKVDRTSWLDLSLGRFKNGKIQLPLDLSTEYKNNIKAPVRVYEKDDHGNPVGRYVKKAHDADHFAHARNYCELALPFVISYGTPQDIVNSPV